MSVEHRDPHTGYLTTGHEWNGITELNTPVPKAVYFFLIVTAVFSLGYWVLMPAWPTGKSYTKGLLGVDQQSVVQASLAQAALDRSAWTKRIEAETFAAIQSDPKLMKTVRQAGRTLFGDNCAACHGTQAKGNKGFPDLTAASTLWGDEPDAIAETIRVGINAAHPQTRVAQMPAFGRDQLLKRDEIDSVVSYVRSLTSNAGQPAADSSGAGKKIFAETCAACHGDDARGKRDMGAPDLTDAASIYGMDPGTVYDTVWGGRQGHMPAWEQRLSPLERKILALYVLDLRRPRP